MTDTKFPVVFEYEGENTKTVDLTVNDGEPITNELIYGTVSGKKIDENGEALGGAVIGLFKSADAEFTAENATLTTESAEDGSFTFGEDTIPYGTWYVREIEQPSLLIEYSPYVKLSVQQGKPIIIYHRNEDKHRKRKKLYESLLPDCDGEDELHSNLSQEDFVSQLIMSDYIKKLLEQLPSEKQRNRIVLRYLLGFTAVEIAEMENVSSQAVDKSIHAGIRSLKKNLI